MNKRVRVIKEIKVWGVLPKGEICVLSQEGAEYFARRVEVIEDTDEEALSLI